MVSLLDEVTVVLGPRKSLTRDPEGNGARSRMIAAETKIAARTTGSTLSGTRTCRRGRRWISIVTLLCSGLVGCSSAEERQRIEWVTSLPPGTTVAVAPAMNASGSSAFDVVQVADLMASELSDVPDVGVIGVNRVLAILAEQGVDQVQSPEHALDLCDRLGADAILVFAITEYDAYTPVVAIAAQLYGKRPAQPALDPVAASRMARPFAVAPRSEATRPWAQAQRTFNAAHESVHQDVRDYAKTRGGDESPYGWRKYLASQERYLRYCCFSIARELVQEPL